MIRHETKAPFTSIAVANTIIERSDLSDLSPMKLQKLLYFAHGWHWAFFDERLLGEPMQAWKYGPVVWQAYDVFRDFGANPITETREVFLDSRLVKPYIDPDGSNSIDLIDEIIRAYGGFSALDLSMMSHKKDSPWDKTWCEKGKDTKFVVIPEDRIKSYFLKMKEEQRLA